MDEKKTPQDGNESERTPSALAQLTRTAYHEAGHAVMAIMLGRSVDKVTVVAAKLQTGGSRLGQVKMQPGRRKTSKDDLEDDVLILLAGMVAESFVSGKYCLSGARQDMRMVERALANRARTERQLQRLVKRAVDKAEHLFASETAQFAIESIATELLQRTTISGRAVRQLYQQAEQKFN